MNVPQYLGGPDAQPVQTDPEGLILCLECDDSAYLHHDEVVVHERLAGEDGDAITTTIRGCGMQQTLTPRAPGRRNSVEIAFWCEICGSRYTLLLMQHKGRTYLEWTRREPRGAILDGTIQDDVDVVTTPMPGASR